MEEWNWQPEFAAKCQASQVCVAQLLLRTCAADIAAMPERRWFGMRQISNLLQWEDRLPPYDHGDERWHRRSVDFSRQRSKI
jgi:hypothetical protein